MPLDGTNWKVKVEPLQTGLAGLKQLGDALRWNIPRNFNWDFTTLGGTNTCGSFGCAIGLACDLWPKQIACRLSHDVADALNIPERDLAPIFGLRDTMSVYGMNLHGGITPHDVADAIDRYIAGKGGVS